MKGPSDKCAAMCRTIERVGLKNLKEFAKSKGRKDPDRDMLLIRHAALSGYVETGRLCGVAASTVAQTVQRYNEYAIAMMNANPRLSWMPDPSGKLADGSYTIFFRQDKNGTFVWLSQLADETWMVSISRDKDGNDGLDLATCPSLHAAKLWSAKRFEF